jgi:hypothetical protein
MTEHQPLPNWVNLATVVRRATVLHFNTSTGILIGNERTREVVYQRHIGMYVARELKLSYPQIGRVFNRDHTSALHGAGIIRELVASKRKRVLDDIEGVRAIVCMLRPSFGSQGDHHEPDQELATDRDRTEGRERDHGAMLEWEARVYWDDELKTWVTTRPANFEFINNPKEWHE